jgi:hypothetical protein
MLAQLTLYPVSVADYMEDQHHHRICFSSWSIEGTKKINMKGGKDGVGGAALEV